MHTQSGRQLLLRALSFSLLVASFASLGNPAPASAAVPGSFVPVAYARILADTSFGAGQTRTLSVLGVGGVPTTGVAAVVVDVSVVSSTASNSTALQVWSSGTAMPTTATIRTNSEIAPTSNTTVVAPGADGKIAVNNVNGTSVVNVDVQGYFAETSAGSSFVAMRGLAVSTNDGIGIAGPIAAGTTSSFSTTAVGVPAGAQAVFANVVALAPAVDGSLTLFAGGSSMPAQSTLQYSDEGSDSSGVMIPVGSDGSISVRNAGPTGSTLGLRIEIQGYMAPGAAAGNFNLMSTPTVLPLNGVSAFSVPAAGHVDLLVGGRNGLPTYGVEGAWLNVTAKDNTAGGNLTIFPKGQKVPSNGTMVLAPANNSSAGVSAATLVPTGFDGLVRIANSSASPVTVTVTLLGWFAGTRVVSAANEAAFIDTAVLNGNSVQMAKLGVWYTDVHSSLIYQYANEDLADPVVEPTLQTFQDSDFTSDPDPDSATITAARSASTASCGGTYELGKYNRAVYGYTATGEKLWKVSWISRWCGSTQDKKVGAKGYFKLDPPEFTFLGSMTWNYESTTDLNLAYKTYNGSDKGGLKMARKQHLTHCAIKIAFCDDVYIRYWVQGNYDLSKTAGGTW